MRTSTLLTAWRLILPLLLLPLFPSLAQQRRSCEPAVVRSTDTTGWAARRQLIAEIESVQDRTMDYDMSIGNIVVRGRDGTTRFVGLNAVVRCDSFGGFVPRNTIESEEFIVPEGGTIELDYRLRVVGPTAPEDLRYVMSKESTTMGGISLQAAVRIVGDTSQDGAIRVIGGKGRVHVNGTQPEATTGEHRLTDISQFAGRRVRVVAALYRDPTGGFRRWPVMISRTEPFSSGHYRTIGISRSKPGATEVAAPAPAAVVHQPDVK